jgi:O-antigen ligase
MSLMINTPDGVGLARRVAELIVVGMACLAPWAFGSVDAWAEFGLSVGTAVVVALVAIADGTSSRARRSCCLTGVGLAGLVLLALFQATPLPPMLFRWVSPTSATLRADLLPLSPEKILGDTGPVVPLPSLQLSQDPGESLKMAARLAAGWLLFQGVIGLSTGVEGLRRLAVAFSINAALLSLFSIIQALTWNGRIFWVRPITFGDAWSVGGPFDHHTHLAEYLNMGLGLALGLAIPGGWRSLLRGKTNRSLATYACCVIAAGIIASNSRGGFLAMLGAGAVIALGLRAHVVGLGLGVAAIVALVALMLMALGDASPLVGRLASITDLGNDGYAVRLELWRAALRAWWAYPIWGTGLGSFPAGTSPYLDGTHGSFFARAENEYLDLLSEGGLVGAALMLLAATGASRLALRALAISASPRDRGLILGAIFGVLALALNSLSDFGPHVAGVGVPAIILIATLCRMGLHPESPSMSEAGPPRRLVRLGWALYGLATAAVGIGLAYHGFADVQVESCLAEAGLPMPGKSPPAMGDFARTGPELDRQRSALETALHFRPRWADGQLRLGMIDLILYGRAVTDGLLDPVAGNSGQAADPIGIFKVIRDIARHRSNHLPGATPPEDEPTRRYLLPAARCFLEARRACPVSPIAHAELASLDHLLVGGDPVSTYLERAFRLAGNRRDALIFAAEVAARAREAGLAARCWRRVLEVDPNGWAWVADSASALLTPDQILDEVVPSGRLAFQFAERLYSDAGSALARRKFLQVATRRLPGDRDIGPGDRLQLEARAWAALDERDTARERMEKALALEPGNFAWRKDLIEWLLRWGRIDEAHEQAKLGIYYSPESKSAIEALDSTADAMARRGTGR